MAQNPSSPAETSPANHYPIDPESPVVVTIEGAVATVRLNRPEGLNSLNIATKELLRDTLAAIAEDRSIRCVVLTGTGRGFCVGQDLKEHIEILTQGDPAQLFETVPKHYNPIVTALATMPKPVIAMVNGVAAGAGASLALACDFRILATSAGFNFAFAGVALSCDTGASWTLPRLVGASKALELLYQPSTIDSATAAELGLATRVVADDELVDTVMALATSLAAGPTEAFAAIRQSVNYSASHSFEESLAFEGDMMVRTGSTQDHQAAVEAFVAKVKPEFHGR